jgi:hypothetical protein
MKPKAKQNQAAATKPAARKAAAAKASPLAAASPAVWLSPKELKPWRDNPRLNDGEPVEAVIESIKRFGFGSVIVARAANREIIAGHTRWKAALALELPQVPVRLLDISEREAHLLALADNRLGELATWSDSLASVLSKFDLAEAELAGWSSEDIEALADELSGSDKPEAELEEDEAPPVPVDPVSRLGDVWQLGAHTLICGDGRQTPVRSFGAVITDPPYGISVVTKQGRVGAAGAQSAKFGTVAKAGKYAPIAGDDSTPDVRWLLERGEVVIMWGGNYFADQLPAQGGWLVWDKRDDSGIENSFADCELAWSNQTGPARVHRQLWNGMIRAGEHEKRKHPTQKPVKLLGFCLKFTSGEVFDPYAGSGTTLIAAEQLGRVCTAVELAPAYCDVIIERWQALTGQSAQRRSGGAA